IGAGLPVALGPAGSATASAYVTVIVFSPHAFPAPPTVDLAVRAVSGNDPSRAASIPARVMDGTSSPALSLAQADGTGGVTFPQFFKVTPPLFAQGPPGGAVIVAGITGTGDNVFRFKAEVQAGSTSGITARYLLGTSTDVTSQIADGTLTLQCYADFGCPPLRVVLTPGTGSGTFTALLTQVSTIDGQSSLGFLSATLSAAVGPDLYTSLPLVGQHVHEATPTTQLSAVGVQTSGTVAKRVFLHNEADVPDTFTVKATQARAPGDTGTMSITATPFGGAPSVVTQPVLAGTYRITLAAGDEVTLDITESAGPTAGLAPASVVLTATSGLAPTKVDAYGVTFPTYFYRPDAVLTGADGRAIGQGIYDKGITQTDTFNTSLAPSSVTVTFADRGTGPWPAPTRDSVVVKAPASSADFTVSYRITTGGTSTDVTSAITGAGLPLQLFANGAVPQTLVVTVASSIDARAGRPGYFPITVTSTTAVPAGLSDTVVVGLYNLGASQLRFAGLPQAEPADITQDAAGIARTAPFPSAGFANGASYGAYPDPTGQKFAYVSGYDQFGLQVAALKTTATTYRLQMAAPSTDSADLPLWERVVFGRSYFNRGQLVRPGDPLAADTGVHPKITVDGRDVTAQVLAGTYTTPSLHSGSTFDLPVAFDPGAAQRYRPLRFNLI
ncbi:MAG TPA: hypothetical protein VGO92_03120, partial [Acidimicrobiales bacterium]|nr:hypothetical protein [Acidimicrobiales bacterium]